MEEAEVRIARQMAVSIGVRKLSGAERRHGHAVAVALSARNARHSRWLPVGSHLSTYHPLQNSLRQNQSTVVFQGEQASE